MAADMADSAQGQDRSNWQTIGGWGDLTFGVCKATEATTYRDPTFSQNWANLKTEGKLRGAYHFFHPSLSPTLQAQYFAETVKGQGLEPGDMLVADIEIMSGDDSLLRLSPHAAKRSALIDSGPGGIALLRQGASVSGVVPLVGTTLVASSALQFLETVEAMCPHNPVLVYTNLSVGQYLGNCTRFGLWIAWPELTAPPSVAPWPRWIMWQWAFSGGYDDCDQDAYNGTAAEMRSWIASYTPDTVEVPNVRGLRVVAEAEPLITERGLTYRTSVPVNPAMEWWVDSQTPGPGEYVARGSNIDLGITDRAPSAEDPLGGSGLAV
jgi:GH25 family lysozyme M1 (1,4-beta-N-acetylmuramidase)